MAKFKEIVYMVLDLLKERSDDSFYTEEHILFLASKMRSYLIERKYKNSRNGVYTPMSEENVQQICVPVEPASLLPSSCGGGWLKSTKKIPSISSASETVTCTGNDLLFSNVTFIAPERMPYVGYNKWLRNIIYASKSDDGHLYLKGQNPQFMNLEQVKLSAVFSDAEEAAKMSEGCTSGTCDLLDMEFPLESALVPSCIELIVQELTGARYAPEDKKNNDRDDLSEAAVVQQRAPRPVERIENRRNYYGDEPE